MFGLGTQELMLVLIMVLIFFGASKLPQIGSGMGQAIRNFKKSVAEAEADGKDPKKDVVGKSSE